MAIQPSQQLEHESTDPCPEDLVQTAITAIEAFAVPLKDHWQAIALLNLWSRTAELNRAERNAVIDHFGRRS